MDKVTLIPVVMGKQTLAIAGSKMHRLDPDTARCEDRSMEATVWQGDRGFAGERELEL
jgi:hypothetical protein